MSAWFQSELTTLALCWRIDRRDGVSLGFTSHDRDLVRDGLTYRATPGMMPSAVSVSDGFDVDTLDIAGALTSDAICEADLARGRWDGAAMRLIAVDWSDPAAAEVALIRGQLGEVAIRAGGFTAELCGPTWVLGQPVVAETSPECRAALGDKSCRVDMAGRVRTARVLACEDAVLTLDRSEPEPNGYALGLLRWIEGANAGATSPIAMSAGNGVTLREPPYFAPIAGALVELREGCDRTLATCSQRFNNAANFRGEPHLPGADLLTRYPSA
jgi:uncharacterized phage protein (TIGR02218 family)